MEIITFESWKNPNETIVRKFADAFDLSFHKDEEELKKLFSSDKSLTDDLIDMCVRKLNVLYHTHLWKVHIDEITGFLKRGGKEFERRIISGDMSVVEDLADRKTRNCFVFATKYC